MPIPPAFKVSPFRPEPKRVIFDRTKGGTAQRADDLSSAARAKSRASGDTPEPRTGTLDRPKFAHATRVVAVFVSVALLAGIGFVVADQQRTARAEITARFDLRAEIAARFLASYVKEITKHEAEVAASKLGGRSVSQARFADVSTVLGFRAAVLLDEDGRLLRVLPNTPDLIGANLGAKYVHMREAVAGRVGVSGVVPSAARSMPVVGFAVPFTSDVGRRTFSGALSISTTSLGTSYLENLSPLKGASVWLIDSTGQTIASSSRLPQSTDLLAVQNPVLFQAVQSGSNGVYEVPTGTSRFAAAAVEGTPWRLIVAAPEAQIFVGLGGLHAALPWIMFMGLVLAMITVVLLQIRLAHARAKQLHDASHLSLTDSMTGLYNRRGYEVLAAKLLRDAAREHRSAVLTVFDMDGLKGINDRLGHAVGDDAIVAAAEILRSTFRDTDVIARLGGDEFCAIGVLPGAGNDGTAQLGRLDDALALYNEREGAPFRLNLSGGLATWDPEHPIALEDLEEEADRRMYADKKTAARFRTGG